MLPLPVKKESHVILIIHINLDIIKRNHKPVSATDRPATNILEDNRMNLVKEAQESRKKILLSALAATISVIAATPLFVISSAMLLKS